MNSVRLGMDERLPLYQRLRDEIVARIAAGEWLPGQAIPTEAELTRQYSVAIGTVRKAVDTLVAEGLLLRSQGRGTFVRRPDFDGSFFRFFRQVDASGERPVPQGQILERRLDRASAQVATALKLEAGAPVVALVRLRTFANQSRFREQIWLPASRFSALLDIEPEAFENLLYPFYESTCGQAVASARETLTVEAADAELVEPLGVAVGGPVIVVQRTAFGYDRAPLEYRISRGSAENFRYQVEIS